VGSPLDGAARGQELHWGFLIDWRLARGAVASEFFDNLVVTSEIFLPAQDCALGRRWVLFTKGLTTGHQTVLVFEWLTNTGGVPWGDGGEASKN
jgi:hypothetical protein